MFLLKKNQKHYCEKNQKRSYWRKEEKATEKVHNYIWTIKTKECKREKRPNYKKEG